MRRGYTTALDETRHDASIPPPLSSEHASVSQPVRASRKAFNDLVDRNSSGEIRAYQAWRIRTERTRQNFFARETYYKHLRTTYPMVLTAKGSESPSKLHARKASLIRQMRRRQTRKVVYKKVRIVSEPASVRRQMRRRQPRKVVYKNLHIASEPASVRRRRQVRAMREKTARAKSGSTMKPKWASLKSTTRPSAVISSVWNRQFAVITRSSYDRVQPMSKGQVEPTLDPTVYGWIEDTLDRLDEDTTYLKMGDIPSQSIRGQQWMFMEISFWLLRYDPDRMVDFLYATHAEPYPPINWIEDSLCHLGKHLTSSDDEQRPIRKQRLLDLFKALAHRTTNERLRFVNEFVRHLLPHCTPEEVSEIYHTIQNYEVEVHGFTLLHFATRCAKEGYFKEASDALLRAKDAGVQVNRENFRSVCSTVIRSCMSQSEGLRVCLGLVSHLVDVGLQLNGPICDIIMLNAVDAGDVSTAFAVYRSLMERGLQPRESTFAILLKGCKLNIDDADMLNGVIRDAISSVNVRQSPLVATEILHCLALHHTTHNPDTALRTITEAYAQLFDMKPLKQLGLPLPPVQQQRATAEEAMQPTPHALGFMISASIQRIQSYSQRPDDIAAIYARWRELVEASHPILSQLATTDHIANTFLMAFIRTFSGLIYASRVVRDMQRPIPTNPHLTTAATVEQCPPTVQTFSIFLHGFTRHGKTHLADQVLAYMRSKGIEPNDVTWNTLVTGYARAQDVEGTFEVLREAERSGYLWNRWTEDGVKWLRGPRAGC